MKFVWEAEDIRMGRIVHRVKRYENKPFDAGAVSDRMYIISYGYKPNAGGQFICMVSMADGMQMNVFDRGQEEEFAARLNEGEYMPISSNDWKKIIIHAADVAVSF